jgi:hypothetical protein
LISLLVLLFGFEYARKDPGTAPGLQMQCVSAAIIIALLYKNTQIFTTGLQKTMGR